MEDQLQLHQSKIRVQFDGVHLVDMKVSKDQFGGNLTGICGNCNGHQI
jgi:hypothetical protein